jgi:hypothetical protein
LGNYIAKQEINKNLKSNYFKRCEAPVQTDSIRAFKILLQFVLKNRTIIARRELFPAGGQAKGETAY